MSKLTFLLTYKIWRSQDIKHLVMTRFYIKVHNYWNQCLFGNFCQSSQYATTNALCPDFWLVVGSHLLYHYRSVMKKLKLHLLSSISKNVPSFSYWGISQHYICGFGAVSKISYVANKSVVGSHQPTWKMWKVKISVISFFNLPLWSHDACINILCCIWILWE